jgi:hypothetical protein
MSVQTALTLFDIEPVKQVQQPLKPPSAVFVEWDEYCYRVTVSGSQVGGNGCGLTLWFDSEHDAIVGAHESMDAWPGSKLATVEMRTVRIVGPRKDDRLFVGFTPVRTVGHTTAVTA